MSIHKGIPGILSFIMVLFFLCEICHAEEQLLNYDFKWLECSEAEQCIIVKDACHQKVTVNKDYKKDVQIYYHSIAPRIKCESITKINTDNTVVACMDGGCRLIPDVKKDK